MRYHDFVAHAIGTLLRLSSSSSVCLSSVMLCIEALYAASSHTRDTGKQINIHSIRDCNIAVC